MYDLIDSTGHWKPSTLQIKQKQLQRDKETAYSGKLTTGAKKRLSKAIDLMCQTIKPRRIYSEIAQREITHRLSFITLTVSQTKNITAREAYDKLLRNFLQWLRRTMKVSTYVWKCEVQKRGQIHYHITTPSYIHYQKIRDKWNNLQTQNGIIEEYRKEQTEWHKGGFKPRPELYKQWPLNKQWKAYQVGISTNWSDPNSTDIGEVRQVKDLAGYLIKEFCKSIQNPNTDGKVWDCSLNLKKWKYYTITETTNKTQELSNDIDTEKFEAIPLEHCIVLKAKKIHTTEIMDLKELQGYNEFLTMIRNYRKDTYLTEN